MRELIITDGSTLQEFTTESFIDSFTNFMNVIGEKNKLTFAALELIV